MNKRLIFTLVVGLFLASCAAAPVADADNGELQSAMINDVSTGFQGQGPDESTHQGTLAALSGADFTQSEIEGILFMFEEEKLARDVYQAMAEMWGMNVFSNIAGSEQTHMEAVLTLVEIAGLEEAVADGGQGVFRNSDLQVLYNDLVERGSQSLAEALLVGGAIEEIDILDLQSYLAGTENPALSEVYQNLLKGSTNHLGAFARSYERQAGEIYQPQFLTEDEFQTLVASSAGAGRGINASAQGRGRGRSN